jgi:hypothetical protein
MTQEENFTKKKKKKIEFQLGYNIYRLTEFRVISGEKLFCPENKYQRKS